MTQVEEHTVAGMTCDHCVRAVREEVGRVRGVVDVQVDLPSGTLIVVSEEPVDETTLRAAVDEAGYELVR